MFFVKSKPWFIAVAGFNLIETISWGYATNDDDSLIVPLSSDKVSYFDLVVSLISFAAATY